MPKVKYHPTKESKVVLLTVHGTFSSFRSCGQLGTYPSFTGALKGQARPNILFLTGKGLSVSPNLLKLIGNLVLSSRILLDEP